MSEKKLKLGVLGLGEGRSIISAALKSELWQLVRMCDLNEKLCQERAAEFSFPHYTTKFDDLLLDASIDVIAIYTPDPMHAKHVTQCLAAGKHVICTKPLIDNLADAAALLEASNKSGKRVFVGQSSRFFAPMMRQRQDFEAGKHGEVFCIEADYSADNRWFLEKQWSRAGVLKWLFNGLSHPVDLVRWYFPDITEVMGYGVVTANGKAVGLQHEDAMQFVLRTASGKIGRVSGAYSSPPTPHMRNSHTTCIMRGTNGCSVADHYDLRYSTHFKGEGCIQYDMEHLATHYFRFGGRGHHAGEYQNYIDYFAKCIAAGESPKPDLSEGIVTVAVMSAMERSLKAGQPVTVKSILAEYNLESLAS